MSDSSIVYDWLELWERHLHAGGSPDLDAFVRDLCHAAPPDHVAAFKKKAEAVRALQPHLRGSPEAPTSGPDSETGGARSADLVVGGEPIPGYKLDRRLGHGAYGEVWRATAPDGR